MPPKMQPRMMMGETQSERAPTTVLTTILWSTFLRRQSGGGLETPCTPFLQQNSSKHTSQRLDQTGRHAQLIQAT